MTPVQTQIAESNEVTKTPMLTNAYLSLGGQSLTQPANLDAALQTIFPSSKEETRIQKARQIMGDEVKGLIDEQLQKYITEFQYLVDVWMDEYEKSVFNNKTLKEVLWKE